MTESMDPIILNLLYAMLGGIMMLLGGWAASSFFRRVMGFDVKAELKAGNVAVGLALMGIYLGTGIGMGLVIGLSLN